MALQPIQGNASSACFQSEDSDKIIEIDGKTQSAASAALSSLQAPPSYDHLTIEKILEAYCKSPNCNLGVDIYSDNILVVMHEIKRILELKEGVEPGPKSIKGDELVINQIKSLAGTILYAADIEDCEKALIEYYTYLSTLKLPFPLTDDSDRLNFREFIPYCVDQLKLPFDKFVLSLRLAFAMIDERNYSIHDVIQIISKFSVTFQNVVAKNFAINKVVMHCLNINPSANYNLLCKGIVYIKALNERDVPPILVNDLILFIQSHLKISWSKYPLNSKDAQLIIWTCAHLLFDDGGDIEARAHNTIKTITQFIDTCQYTEGAYNIIANLTSLVLLENRDKLNATSSIYNFVLEYSHLIDGFDSSLEHPFGETSLALNTLIQSLEQFKNVKKDELENYDTLKFEHPQLTTILASEMEKIFSATKDHNWDKMISEVHEKLQELAQLTDELNTFPMGPLHALQIMLIHKKKSHIDSPFYPLIKLLVTFYQKLNPKIIDSKIREMIDWACYSLPKLKEDKDFLEIRLRRCLSCQNVICAWVDMPIDPELQQFAEAHFTKLRENDFTISHDEVMEQTMALYLEKEPTLPKESVHLAINFAYSNWWFRPSQLHQGPPSIGSKRVNQQLSICHKAIDWVAIELMAEYNFIDLDSAEKHVSEVFKTRYPEIPYDEIRASSILFTLIREKSRPKKKQIETE